MKILKLSMTVLLGFLFAGAFNSQDLTYQQIVEKHLDAFGSKDARDALKNLTIVGFSEFESVNPSVKGGGRAVVISEPNNLLFAMRFNSRDYPFEKIGYFTDKVSIPLVNSGRRSLLGAFLAEHNNILTDGLFAGTMSARWPLSLFEKKKSKIRSLGTKKINGSEVYVLEYIPSKGGSDEFSVKVYFDAANFNHVRTEYRREVRAGKIRLGNRIRSRAPL